ncbi:hypothetical protein CEXT_497931 [Caerostris extrusa]|uniref:Uncharacterized protein n=1 Tax=Caerostris extrusa TaxID=172846 RepID=A0AAV4TC29_CAEEX|nr:hypothetical protein CEXT_497931 [Caerostris extrusa]
MGKGKKIRKDDTTEAFDGLMSKSHPPVWVVWTLLKASVPANLSTTDARVFFLSMLQDCTVGDGRKWNTLWNRFREGWCGGQLILFLKYMHLSHTGQRLPFSGMSLIQWSSLMTWRHYASTLALISWWRALGNSCPRILFINRKFMLFGDMGRKEIW